MFEYYGNIHVCCGHMIHIKFGFNWPSNIQVVSEEKMFEHYGNIHVCCGHMSP